MSPIMQGLLNMSGVLVSLMSWSSFDFTHVCPSRSPKERLRNIFSRHQASHRIHYLVDGALYANELDIDIDNNYDDDTVNDNVDDKDIDDDHDINDDFDINYELDQVNSANLLFEF